MGVLPICEQTDFVIKSVPDQVEFRVQRRALETAEVFRDMFALCDRQSASADANNAQPISDSCYLELDERAEDLRTLLELLHRPPSPPPPPPPPPPPLPPPPPSSPVLPAESHEEESERAHWLRAPFLPLYDPAHAIPFPLLPRMLRLADKYSLPATYLRTLHAHLLANAFVHPLRVYGFAVAAAAAGVGAGLGSREGEGETKTKTKQKDKEETRSLADIAAQASAYLLDPPIATYTRTEIVSALTVEAYHDLVRLHAYRIAQLRAILVGEDIFPFGYGACEVHRAETVHVWDGRRVQLALRIEAASDLAAEMRVLLDQFSFCQTCHQACIAATDMLEYKCRRLPRTIAQLPPE